MNYLSSGSRLAACLYLACGVILATSSPAVAQNIALGKPVINGSSAWNGNPFNAGDFSATHVTDGALGEDAADVPSYWLGNEGSSSEFFTIDLGAMYNIDELKLFNTHNRQYNDRGTNAFALFAGNTINGSNIITDEALVFSGNLTNVAGLNPIPFDLFNLNAGPTVNLQARYLRFQTTSAHPGFAGVGLNEFQVFDTAAVNPNIAAAKPVIEGSGSWNGGTPGVGDVFNGGPFPATTVTNSSVSDAPGAYWLGREGTADEHFTLDLQSPQPIQEILLRNTHNSASNDRGTKQFQIVAGDAVDANNRIINPTVILQGQLPNVAGYGVIPSSVFTAANGLTTTTARYLEFQSLSSYYGANNVGLNELEVFNTVQPTHTPAAAPRANLAAGKSVIAGSGSYDGGTDPNAGTFPASRVTDESTADANTGRTSYWLGRENTSGEHFTIDLGADYLLSEIDLRNTHNAQYNDRGTNEFVLEGALAVDALNQMLNPIVLANGNLTRTDGLEAIPADVFSIANGQLAAGGPVRYLRFTAVSFYFSPTNGGAGLNEFEAYGVPVPEPGTFLLAALGAVGLLLVSRRQRRGAPASR